MLYRQYFWLIIAFVLLVAIHFAMKKSPSIFPGVGKFLNKFLKKHEKGITKINNIFWICMVLLWSYFWFSMLYIFRMDFTVLSESESIRTMFIKSDRCFLFSILIIWSGTSGFFVGFLSFFQSNITKIKRIILLIVCLLPILLTVIQVLTGTTESLWLTIQLCIYFSIYSWIINMPSVLVGKSLSELLGNIHKKVKLMFSHHAG